MMEMHAQMIAVPTAHASILTSYVLCRIPNHVLTFGVSLVMEFAIQLCDKNVLEMLMDVISMNMTIRLESHVSLKDVVATAIHALLTSA